MISLLLVLKCSIGLWFAAILIYSFNREYSAPLYLLKFDNHTDYERAEFRKQFEKHMYGMGSTIVCSHGDTVEITRVGCHPDCIANKYIPDIYRHKNNKSFEDNRVDYPEVRQEAIKEFYVGSKYLYRDHDWYAEVEILEDLSEGNWYKFLVIAHRATSVPLHKENSFIITVHKVNNRSMDDTQLYNTFDSWTILTSKTQLLWSR